MRRGEEEKKRRKPFEEMGGQCETESRFQGEGTVVKGMSPYVNPT